MNAQAVVFAYTLMGDAVAVAARLTQLAGGRVILIFTELAVRAPDLLNEVQIEEMPPVSLKGKDAPGTYFRLVDRVLPGAVFEKWMSRTQRSNERRRA